MEVIPYYLELAGISVFAISGALAASEKNEHYNDLFSIFFTGFVTSIGGGTLRDVFLGNYPVSWIKDENFLWAILVGFFFISIFPKTFMKLRKELFLFDTLGVGIYTAIGTRIAIDYGVNQFAAVLLGMISAIFGGVIRDTLLNQIPFMFRKEIYATACLAGSIVYIILYNCEVDANINICITSSTVIIIRLISVKFKLSLPEFKLPQINNKL